MKTPFQPIYTDEHGTYRFQKNSIVEWLLEAGPFDMNVIALTDFPQEDRIQFAQLIGYSVSGFSELGYVPTDRADIAQQIAESGLTTEREATNVELEFYRTKLKALREALLEPIAELYGIHPDDLRED